MSNFGWINWIVLAGVMLAITLAGHLLKGKTKGLEGFFLGGNSLPWWAVSVSIMATQLSAVTVIAVPGFIFAAGGNLLFLQGTLIGFVVAKILMVLLFVKPLYEKKYFSPYEFIEDRLGSGASTLSRTLFMFSAIPGHGIRLLTIAIVLSVVISIPIGQSILFIGIFAVIWTLMGGVTTVVWTDFFLFLLILLGPIATIVTVFNGLPFGLAEALRQLDDAAKLKLISVSLDPAKTWTIWTSLLCFTIFELAQNSVDQVVTQRMMCCRNAHEARKAILGSLSVIIITLLMSVAGLGLWLYYQHHALSPSDTAFLAEQPSRAYPFYVIRNLPVGVSGLVIAAIFAAGISTLDAALAALSETTVNGIYRKHFRPNAEDAHYLRASRIFVVVWGIILSVLAYLVGQLVQKEGLLNMAYKIPILTYGPMLMIALFALARRGSKQSLIAGAAVSVGIALILLVLMMKGVVSMDEFWIYPITCLVFFGVWSLYPARCPEDSGARNAC